MDNAEGTPGCVPLASTPGPPTQVFRGWAGSRQAPDPAAGTEEAAAAMAPEGHGSVQRAWAGAALQAQGPELGHRPAWPLEHGSRGSALPS